MTAVAIEAPDIASSFTDRERDAIEIAFDKDYARQRITFVAGPLVVDLLGLDTDFGTIKPTGVVVGGGAEFECRRQTGHYILSVATTAINRRCMYAESHLKADQVKALEVLEIELRKCVRRKTPEAS